MRGFTPARHVVITLLIVALALTVAACAPSATTAPSALPSAKPVYFLSGTAGSPKPAELIAVSGVTGRALWRHSTGGIADPSFAPLVVGGVIYALTSPSVAGISGDSVLQAFRASDGALLWAQPAMGQALQEPVVVGAMVYLTLRTADISHPGVVEALRASSGAVVWRATLAETVTAVTVAGGLALLTGAGLLMAFNAQTGALAWDFSTALSLISPTGLVTAPLIVGSSLIVNIATEVTGASPTYHLLALDVATGVEQWIVAMNGLFSRPTSSSGLVYLSVTLDNQTGLTSSLFALNPHNGATVWRYAAPANVDLSAPLAFGGSIVLTQNLVTSLGDTVPTAGAAFALNGATGRLLWRTQLGAEVADGIFPWLINDGAGWVFIRYPASASAIVGEFAQINLSDGALRWEKSLPAINLHAFVQDGAVYSDSFAAGDANGAVTAVRFSDGATLWTFNA